MRRKYTKPNSRQRLFTAFNRQSRRIKREDLYDFKPGVPKHKILRTIKRFTKREVEELRLKADALFKEKG